MKQAKKILKYLGISTEEVVSFDDVVEVVTWSPDSINVDHSSAHVTHLEDGFVVAKKTCYFRTPQRLPRTSDVVPKSEEVETLQLPIEVNVVVETPSSGSRDNSDSSLMNNWLNGNSVECRPSDVQQATTELMPVKSSKLRRLKKAISKLLLRRSKSSSRVSTSNDFTTVQELNVEAESSVCDAVKRMRQRRAMFYV